MSSTVSLVRGDQRQENIIAALDAIQEQIHLDSADRILVKPNLITGERQLAATHVDAVRAVLAWLRQRTDAPIIVGEGTAMTSTQGVFEQLGYAALPKEFRNVSLLDLNTDDTVEVTAHNWRLQPMRLEASRIAVETPYRISVAPPKTHDTVLVTLGLKNMVMGCLVSRISDGQRSKARGLMGKMLFPAERLYNLLPHPIRTSLPLVTMKELATSLMPSSKTAMHQGLPVMHLNLFELAPRFFPHLSILDGFEAMEGNGPTDGDPVQWRVAIAGADWLSTDITVARLMGFSLEEVGYLLYASKAGYGVADEHDIHIVGNVAPQDVRRRFRRHAIERAQLHWHSDRVSQYLVHAHAFPE
jgi:uncharacterized protein (DUF362 family)